MEASKSYYAAQRKYDPFRELWVSLVKRTHSDKGGFDKDGFDRLTPDEKLYYTVSILDGEVYNGGMHQFFSNSSGTLFAEVVEGLKCLSADTALELVLEASRILFGDVAPPCDQQSIWNAMPMYQEDDLAPTPQWCIDLEEVDRAYCEDPDKLCVRLSNFAEEKGLVQPFKKD